MARNGTVDRIFAWSTPGRDTMALAMPPGRCRGRDTGANSPLIKSAPSDSLVP